MANSTVMAVVDGVPSFMISRVVSVLYIVCVLRAYLAFYLLLVDLITT